MVLVSEASTLCGERRANAAPKWLRIVAGQSLAAAMEIPARM
jgi:hypothetical protein